MPKREPDQELDGIRKRFQSVPTFKKEMTHEEFGTWCRAVYNELTKDRKLGFNDRIAVYHALRSRSAGDFSKFGKGTWAAKNPRPTVDAIEGIDYIQQGDRQQSFAEALSKMLPASFKGGHDYPPSIKSVAAAAEFLCGALDKTPSALLQAIKKRERNFDALSTDHYRVARVPRHLRENLYCLITFLQIKKSAQKVKDIIDAAAGNRASERTDPDSASKAKLKGKQNASQVFRAPPKFSVPSDIFFAYVQSLYTWRYEHWQTPARKIRHNFSWNASDLSIYIQRLQEELDAEDESQSRSSTGDSSDGDIESQTGSSKTRDDQKSAHRLALEFVHGLSPDKLSNPGIAHAKILRSLYEGYLEYCAEHAAVVSAEGAYGHAKLHKLTATQQMRILNAHSNFIGGAFAGRGNLLEELTAFLGRRLKAREKLAASFPTPVRLMVASARAGLAAQGTGRAIAALLGLYALANIGNVDIIGPVVGLFVVEVFLCVSSAAYLGYRHGLATAPNNHRRITKVLFWTALSTSLCTPVIAAACQALNGDLESEIERLSNGTSGNATQADLTRLNFLVGVQQVGGPAAWLIGSLLTASIAKIVRQVMQTMTVSQYSAGLSVTYLDNTPLTDDDREVINASRDALYIASTTALLGATAFVSISPAVWSTMLLGMANEAVDEVNPDLAILMANFFRGASAQYAGSNATFKITRGNTPRLATFAQFKSHFLPQAASRLSVAGLSDVMSQCGDICRLRNQSALSQAFKMMSVLLSGMFGARRGAMATYMADGGSGNPSGLPSLLMRTVFGVRDAVGRIQVRPALKADMVSLNYENHRFKEPRLVWPWKTGRRLNRDGALLANVFPPDNYRTFHQCEAQHARLAALNMLIMHWRDDHALLLDRSDAALHALPMPELCEYLNAQRQRAQELDPPSASGLLPEFACLHLAGMRSKPRQAQIFDDAPAACAVYKDAANEERVVFIRRVSEVELDDADLATDDTEADDPEETQAKLDTEALRSSEFRIYSPLMHCPQLDTKATTMGEAIGSFLEAVEAQPAQPVTVAYNVSHVDIAPETSSELDALISEFLKHPPRLPTLPGLVSLSDVPQAKPLKLQPVAPKPAKRLDTVTKADRFSGAVNTLFNDFVSGLSDEKAQTIRANVDKIRKSDTNRPKWSVIPGLLQSTGIEFVYAKATCTRGTGVVVKASGKTVPARTIDTLSAIAVSYTSDESERRVAIFREAQGELVAHDLRSGDPVEFNDILIPDATSDAIECLLKSAGVDTCAVLFISPRKRGTSSGIESSSSPDADSDSGKDSTRKHGELGGGAARAKDAPVQVTLGYADANAWQTQGLAFEASRADNPLAGAVNTLVLHHIRDDGLLRGTVPGLLDVVSAKLRKQKGLKWQDLQKHPIQVRLEFASVTKKNTELVYDPPASQKSVRKLRVLAVRIDNAGAVGGDYVLFKVSDTQYAAVHTGTAERSMIELDLNNVPNMDSALWRFLYAVKQTHCDILYIAA